MNNISHPVTPSPLLLQPQDDIQMYSLPTATAAESVVPHKPSDKSMRAHASIFASPRLRTSFAMLRLRLLSHPVFSASTSSWNLDSPRPTTYRRGAG